MQNKKNMKNVIMCNLKLWNRDNGTIRWDVNLVLTESGKFGIEDTAPYSLFSTHEEDEYTLACPGKTPGQALDNFLEVEYLLLEQLAEKKVQPLFIKA